MKLVLALTVAIIAFSTACSITHRSNEYACETQTDCPNDRFCSQGYCLATGAIVDAPPIDPKKDAPDQPIDAPSPMPCPDNCTSCNVAKHECKITCGAPGTPSCQTAQVACPAGWNCNIECKNTGDCKFGIDCGDAASCAITCSGAGSCRSISCGDGPCDVNCSGLNSCTQNIQCNNSCRCDVHCGGSGQATCGGSTGAAAMCGEFACDAQDGGCSSSVPSPGQCSTTCP